MKHKAVSMKIRDVSMRVITEVRDLIPAANSASRARVFMPINLRLRDQVDMMLDSQVRGTTNDT